MYFSIFFSLSLLTLLIFTFVTIYIDNEKDCNILIFNNYIYLYIKTNFIIDYSEAY